MATSTISKSTVYKVLTSDSSGNLAKILDVAGCYLFVMKYPTDGSAYYISVAFKQDSANAVHTVIASNKLSVGIQNTQGTIVPYYNGTATSGIVGTAYKLN